MRRLAVPLAALLLAAAALPSAAAVKPAPRCFGAASLDPLKPCSNGALRGMVTPTPRRALRLPNAPCSIRQRSFPMICHFGVPEDRAKGFVALIGDSHAVQWGAALGPIALDRKWHGYRISRLGCPLSTAPPVLDPFVRAKCLEWRPALMRWLRDHDEVRTVVVSQHRPHVAGGLTAEVEGYLEAWRALPGSVRRVIVIRDTPGNPGDVRSCVAGALARGRDAGRTCAVPRSRVLAVDPAAIAARRSTDRRVRLIDMTRWFCDEQRCYPVIGGALVHKDESHITATYGATLAPYLRRKLLPLLR